MASTKFVTLLTVLVILAPTIAMATEFIVGDDSGWKTNFDYQAWARGKDFQVGDTLVFKYKAPNHNVFKVNGTGFKECIKPTANDQAPLTTGNDKIELKTSGNKWYICSVKNHCADLKMKLFINVAEKSFSVRGIGISGFQVFIPAFVVAIAAIVASFA